MSRNGNYVIIGLLLLFWLFLAVTAFQDGEKGRAGIYLLVGLGLTTWRVSRLRN
jgi:hypothetical protein